MRRRIEFPGYQERMRAAFAALGLSQAELARKTRLPQAQLSRWLSGAMPENIETLRVLCAALGIRWEWAIIGDEGYLALVEYMRKRTDLRHGLPGRRVMPLRERRRRPSRSSEGGE